MLFFAGRAGGADANWITSSGNWSDAKCWLNGEPNVSMNANISNGGTATVNQPGEACAYLTLGTSYGQSGSVNMLGGAFTANRAYVGWGGVGTIGQATGDAYFSNDLYLGLDSNSQGTYQLQDGNLKVGSFEYVGFLGVGTFTHTGGTHTVGGQLIVGSDSGGTGNYILSGGALSVTGHETLGDDDGNGTFTQTGGTHTVSGGLTLADNGSGTGIYSLAGAASFLNANSENIGSDGNCTAIFIQTGGTNTVSTYLTVGGGSDSSGSYSLGGGTLNVCGGEIVGTGGHGTLTQTGGTHTVSSFLILGFVSGAAGIYGLDGGALTVDGNVYVGGGIPVTDPDGIEHQPGPGNGTFVQTGGRHMVSGQLYVGYCADANGSYALEGGDLIASRVFVGEKGRGAFAQSDGNVRILQTLSIATEGNSVGGYTLQGGHLFAGEIIVGGTSTAKGGTGTFRIAGGTAAVDERLVIWEGSAAHLGAGTLVDSDANHPYLDVDNKGTIYVEEGVYTLGCVGGPGGAATGTIVVESNATLWVTVLEQASLTIEPGGTVYLSGSDPNYPDMNVHNDGTLYTGYGPIYFGLLDGDGNTFIGWDEATFLSLAAENYAQAVPEPAVIVLVGLGVGFLTARRRRRVSRV